MRKMVIVWDIDGTLIDTNKFYIEKGSKLFKQEPKNPSAHEIDGMYDINKAQEVLFGLKCYIPYCKNEPFREYVKNVYLKYSNLNCENHVGTARKFAANDNIVGDVFQKLCVEQFAEQGLKVDSFNFCASEHLLRDKLLVCKKLKADLMIEDNFEVAQHLVNNGIKVILIDTPANRGMDDIRIPRVTNEEELDNEVNKIYEEVSKNNKDFVKLSKEELSLLSEEELVEYFKQYRYYLKTLPFDQDMIKTYEKRFKNVYKVIKGPLKIVAKRYKYIGLENIPHQGGFIMIANHASLEDEIPLAIARGKYTVAIAKKKLKNLKQGPIYDYFGSILCIDNDKSNKQQNHDAMEEFAHRLTHDQTGLLFPEGTKKTSVPGHEESILLPKFEPGPFVVAQRTGNALLPIAMELDHDGDKLVRIGELIHIEPTETIEDAMERTYKIMYDLAVENLKELGLYVEAQGDEPAKRRVLTK